MYWMYQTPVKWNRQRALEASLAPVAVVSEVARAYGVTPQQLFGWCREARRNIRLPASLCFDDALILRRDKASIYFGNLTGFV